MRPYFSAAAIRIVSRVRPLAVWSQMTTTTSPRSGSLAAVGESSDATPPFEPRCLASTRQRASSNCARAAMGTFPARARHDPRATSRLYTVMAWPRAQQPSTAESWRDMIHGARVWRSCGTSQRRLGAYCHTLGSSSRWHHQQATLVSRASCPCSASPKYLFLRGDRDRGRLHLVCNLLRQATRRFGGCGVRRASLNLEPGSSAVCSAPPCSLC